ncbi:CAAX prenyl protease-like protein [Blastococcus colisei]|uniref:CAAX prenyl protease-like protein n=1 Tax=Blastococcus colisei TaxID=1564162 RepID=A0A543PEW2_9ACTN|nr:CPBP family intramembrane glutamic endopeptidase [Blastococcus colisei]TQN42620.1 CAAX prenyl protease-like protein [Blastococcus colisei]
MHGRAVGRRGLIGLTAGLVAVLVAWNNVVVPRLPGYPGSYVLVNLAAAVALLAAARSVGLAWDELGLARRRVPAGLRWGGVCVALVAAGYAIAVAVPALRPVLTDARVGGMDGAEIAYQAVVRVPLGTVLWEEVAFRGVLLAAFLRLLSPTTATAASSAVFGVWHIRPTLSALAANDVVDGFVPTAAAVVLACLGTAAAGALFTWLRVRSGSLVAPTLLHLATNSLGTLAAAAAWKLA